MSDHKMVKNGTKFIFNTEKPFRSQKKFSSLRNNAIK